MAYIKIRKNASKKIAALIAEATQIVIETQSMGLDDSWNSNGETEITAAEVFKFMEDNYSDLIVRLHTDDEGNNLFLSIQDGPYYFSDEIIVRFTPRPVEKIETVEVKEEVKPRMTLEAVQAFLKAGFVAPLSSEVRKEEAATDDVKRIEKIKVLWSESGFFNRTLRMDNNFDINKEVSIDQYNWLAAAQVADMKREGYTGGYFKTKVEITTGDGNTYTFRHDISPVEPTLSGEWAAWVDYCRAEEEKKAAVVH